MQSAAKPTGRPRCSATAAATGFSEFASSGPPLGRPKWASRMTLPPLSEISRMVGSTRSMRVASETLPFSMGTLRSTRSRTRLPLHVGGVEGAEGVGHGCRNLDAREDDAGDADQQVVS